MAKLKAVKQQLLLLDTNTLSLENTNNNEVLKSTWNLTIETRVVYTTSDDS
jgi:hypothetical protein